tara:strand:- start:59 stop:640 length:582 start_codon:yes stop_codon:yes gene_type:complete
VNLPNILSISRIPMVFLIVTLMVVDTFETKRWALALFILSSLTDWIDGYLARKWNQVTDLGKFMDALADKVLTVGLLVALAILDKMPDWALFAVLLILTREFMVTGLRLVAAGKGRVLPAEGLGKWKTTLQMVAIGLFLLVDVLDGSPTLSLLQNFGQVVLIAATVLTVVSGLLYFFKQRDLFQEASRSNEEA